MLIKEFKATKIRRYNLKINFNLYEKKHYRYFCFSGKNFFSKNIKGHRSLRTKKKSNFNLFWNYRKTNHPYTSLNVVLYIFFSLKLFKFISIIKNSQGSVYSKLSTENHNLFNYFYFKIPRLKDNWFKFLRFTSPIIKKINFESFLFLIERRSFINNIELFFNSGYKYARAVGSKARILDTNKEYRVTQVMLPSKEVKLFDMYSTCNQYKLILNDKKKLLYDDKRYKRYSGNGPIVRGVAMNAIDHPHGGKTKSIKYPKTPWGFTTKYK